MERGSGGHALAGLEGWQERWGRGMEGAHGRAESVEEHRNKLDGQERLNKIQTVGGNFSYQAAFIFCIFSFFLKKKKKPVDIFIPPLHSLAQFYFVYFVCPSSIPRPLVFRVFFE